MHLKGERWILFDLSEVTILKDLAEGMLSVINKNGKLEAIHESSLKERVDQI